MVHNICIVTEKKIPAIIAYLDRDKMNGQPTLIMREYIRSAKTALMRWQDL